MGRNSPTLFDLSTNCALGNIFEFKAYPNNQKIKPIKIGFIER